MEGAFTHVGNHLVSDSASTINAGDDESILDGLGTRRRRTEEDDDGEYDDDDLSSMASMAVDGMNGKLAPKAEEDAALPPHACA